MFNAVFVSDFILQHIISLNVTVNKGVFFMHEKAYNTDMFEYITLDKLPLQESGKIDSLNICAKARRRLLDLGFTKGNEIRALYTSALGDPIGYKIMGCTIALRKKTASCIKIQKHKDDTIPEVEKP